MAPRECHHGRRRAGPAAPGVNRDAGTTLGCSLISKSTMGGLFVQRFAGRPRDAGRLLERARQPLSG